MGEKSQGRLARCQNTGWPPQQQLCILTPMAGESSNMAENLNKFYCRFDQSNHSLEREELIAELTPVLSTQANLELQQVEVELMLRRIIPNRAPGPDWICGWLLKACSNRLASVFCHLFNHSLSEHSVPTLWKSSIICPIAKKSTLVTMTTSL